MHAAIWVDSSSPRASGSHYDKYAIGCGLSERSPTGRRSLTCAGSRPPISRAAQAADPADLAFLS